MSEDYKYYIDNMKTFEDIRNSIYCGCGCGDEWLQVMYNILKTIRIRKDETIKQSMEYLENLFNNNVGLEFLVYYYLDQSELVKHNTCLPGYLSEKGLVFLRFLEKFGTGVNFLNSNEINKYSCEMNECETFYEELNKEYCEKWNMQLQKELIP